MCVDRTEASMAIIYQTDQSREIGPFMAINIKQAMSNRIAYSTSRSAKFLNTGFKYITILRTKMLLKMFFNFVFIIVRPVVVMASPRIQQSLFQTTMITSTVTGNPIYSLYWEFNYKPIRSVSGDCFFTLSGDKYCVTSGERR